MVGSLTAQEVMWLALAFLFIALGGGCCYLLWRTGRLLKGLQDELHRTVDEVVPVISNAAVGAETVNSQLAKVELMLDSAVDMTDALDTTVRAVSMAVVEPVKKVSGAFAGVGEGVASFRDRVSEDGDAGNSEKVGDTA